jgi:RHS repeat-associated protein
MQNRIMKAVKTGVDTVFTFYIRDAQGNVLGVYTRTTAGTPTIKWAEQYIYGSGRLGSFHPGIAWTATSTYSGPHYATTKKLLQGQRRYELSNHLGNVLATINDRRIPRDTKIPQDNIADYYDAVVLSAQDYYPFGMEMPGRTFVLAAGQGSRYGFNGKEKDPNEFGALTHYDFSARVYNPALGRFLSTDRLSSVFSGWSPYNSAMNSPLYLYDPTGMAPEKCPTCPQDDAWKDNREDDRNWTYDKNTNTANDEDALRSNTDVDYQKTLKDVVVVGERKSLYQRIVDVADKIGDHTDPFTASIELQLADKINQRLKYHSFPRGQFNQSVKNLPPVDTPVGKVKVTTALKTAKALKGLGIVTAGVSVLSYANDYSNGEQAKAVTGILVTAATIALPILCPPCAAATIVASAAYSLYLEDKIFPGEEGRPQ